MKNSFLLLVFSILFLNACSENVSAADQLKKDCENGITESCLVGEWHLMGLYDVNYQGDYTDYLFPPYSPPSVLTFNKDNTFEYQFSSTYSDKACPAPQGGNWSLNGKVLVLSPRRGDCIPIGDIKLVPSITRTDYLDLNDRPFHDTEIYQKGFNKKMVEIYQRQ